MAGHRPGRYVFRALSSRGGGAAHRRNRSTCVGRARPLGGLVGGRSPFLIHHAQETRMYPLVRPWPPSTLLLAVSSPARRALGRRSQPPLPPSSPRTTTPCSSSAARCWCCWRCSGGRPADWLPAGRPPSLVIVIAWLERSSCPRIGRSVNTARWLAFPGVVWSCWPVTHSCPAPTTSTSSDGARR